MSCFLRHVDVMSGYAALNVGGGYVGVIAGNVYCKETRETSAEALDDAKEMLGRGG